MNTSQNSGTRFLTRPEGRIAYTVDGAGPLVVAVPGMGDLGSTYRDLSAPLIAAGYRVAVTELRGHGDSDSGFRAHGDTVTAGDILALIDELGGPALVIGNSMAGSAAVIAADLRPDAVAGLVLLSPFVRGNVAPGMIGAMRLVFRAMFARPWGSRLWSNYYATTLNKGAKAAWLPEHVARIRSVMSDPAKLREFRALTAALDHREVEPHVAGAAATPSLTLIGALDPDYKDPAAELAHIGEVLRGETVLVPDAAHYVQSQRPDVVVPRVLAFAGALRAGAGSGADVWAADETATRA